ncbi:hypothetical protein CASFOL_030061 [Castilleja foliolosa]|uniref:Heat shock factor binding protein 1 n=1 Tax=Castilleja foliolosa TaxID=1961234 RepID=A0ABD3CAA9_9LAMI
MKPTPTWSKGPSYVHLTQPSLSSKSFRPIFTIPLSIFCADFISEQCDGHDGDNTKQSTADMTAFVQNLLQQMVPNNVLNYVLLDEMGNRIDELEQSINDLRTEMGQEGSSSPSAALKIREEPKSSEDS